MQKHLTDFLRILREQVRDSRLIVVGHSMRCRLLTFVFERKIRFRGSLGDHALNCLVFAASRIRSHRFEQTLCNRVDYWLHPASRLTFYASVDDQGLGFSRYICNDPIPCLGHLHDPPLSGLIALMSPTAN